MTKSTSSIEPSCCQVSVKWFRYDCTLRGRPQRLNCEAAFTFQADGSARTSRMDVEVAACYCMTASSMPRFLPGCPKHGRNLARIIRHRAQVTLLLPLRSGEHSFARMSIARTCNCCLAHRLFSILTHLRWRPQACTSKTRHFKAGKPCEQDWTNNCHLSLTGLASHTYESTDLVKESCDIFDR